MISDILIVVGGIFALAGVWPFGPYQLSLIAARRLRGFPPAPDPARTVSTSKPDTYAICLCAYNEAAVIVEKIEDLLRLREAAQGALDILVYVDGAADGTASILAPYAHRIRLVVSAERRGKTHGMNLLVTQTAASIVMFTDANVRIDRSAVAVLRRYFADPSIGCVCSHLTYVNSARSATASVGSAFWSFNEWSKGLETATGSVIGADGSLFAIRRQLHRPVPDGLIDDLVVSLTVLLAGYRVVRAPELRAYETHTTAASDEFRRKARIACQCMNVHFALWPQLRRLGFWNLYKYIGHRLLRWIGGYLLVVAMLMFAIGAALAFGMVAVTVAGVLLLLAVAVAWQARLGPVMKLLNVVLALAGNVVGVWRSARGERAVIWEPLGSARETGPGGPSPSR